MRKATILFTAGALAGCAGKTSQPSAPLPAPRPGFPVYEGTVSLDPATKSLRAQWLIRFVRAARTADSVTLLLNAGFTVSRVAGPGVSSHSQDTSSNPRRLTVRFAPGTAADAPIELEIGYAGMPRFSEDSINGIGPNWVELGLDSYWHPVFDDYAQSLTALVRLELPEGWTVVASGSSIRSGRSLLLRNTVPLIDIAFAGSPVLRSAAGKRVQVYHMGAAPAFITRLLETTQSCAEYLDARYGAPVPLPPVKLVLSPRTGPGYARKNYIVIAGSSDTAGVPLKRFVCHELAHNWSTGAIASGPENWLNEAFAEFVSARYVRASEPDSAHAKLVAQWQERSQGQPAIWTPDATRRPGPRTAYAKAPYLLHRLEERVGAAVMDRILTRYMLEPLRTTPAVIRMIGEVAGEETALWFREELAAR